MEETKIFALWSCGNRNEKSAAVNLPCTCPFEHLGSNTLPLVIGPDRSVKPSDEAAQQRSSALNSQFSPVRNGSETPKYFTAGELSQTRSF